MPLNKKRYNRQKVNKRILAIHSAIADKLIRQPDLISKVWHCLEKRTEQNLLRYSDKLVWQDLLPLLDQDPQRMKKWKRCAEKRFLSVFWLKKKDSQYSTLTRRVLKKLQIKCWTRTSSDRQLKRPFPIPDQHWVLGHTAFGMLVPNHHHWFDTRHQYIQ